MRLSLSRPAPIGLDIGSCSIKAVQCKRTRAGFVPIATARFSRVNPGQPVDADELATVAGILRRRGFVGHELVVPAPADKLKTGPIDLPARGANVPLERLARAEFSRLHKIDLATSEFASWEVPSSVRAAKGTSLMGVAYPHCDAEQQINSFEQAGFRLRAIDIHGTSLVRACGSQIASTGAAAILELGWSAAVLVLVRNQVAAYERRIPDLALSKLHGDLQEHMRQSFEDVLAAVFETPGERPPVVTELLSDYYTLVGRELSKTFSYMRHQYPDAPVERVVLAGGGGGLPYIAEQVQTHCGVESRSFELAGFPAEQNASAMASAYGLSRFSA